MIFKADPNVYIKAKIEAPIINSKWDVRLEVLWKLSR